MDTNLSVIPDIIPVTFEDPARYRAELRKAAEEFEGTFMAQLYRIMNQTVLKSELFGNIPGQDLYKDIFITEIARLGSMAQEIGIAELLYQSLGGDIPYSQNPPARETESGSERLEISEVKNGPTKRIGTVRHP